MFVYCLSCKEEKQKKKAYPITKKGGKPRNTALRGVGSSLQTLPATGLWPLRPIRTEARHPRRVRVAEERCEAEKDIIIIE
jgi:hypothetical protein